jgi:hypothetical protein
MSQPNWIGKKVLREEKWSRVYEADDGSAVQVSKFVTDDIEVSEAALRSEWGSWSESDRLAFAHAFGRKPTFSTEDERVLDFLMGVPDERVHTSIAVALTRHSQKGRILNFLVKCLQLSNEPKANYAHALGLLGDTSVIPVLKSVHDRLASEIEPNMQFAAERTLLDFVACCSALMKLEDSSSYRDEIRPLLSHPNPVVRNFSKVFLDGGPPSR